MMADNHIVVISLHDSAEEATTRCKTLCRQIKAIANHTEGQHIQPEGRRTLQ